MEFAGAFSSSMWFSGKARCFQDQSQELKWGSKALIDSNVFSECWTNGLRDSRAHQHGKLHNPRCSSLCRRHVRGRPHIVRTGPQFVNSTDFLCLPKFNPWDHTKVVIQQVKSKRGRIKIQIIEGKPHKIMLLGVKVKIVLWNGIEHGFDMYFFIQYSTF